MRLMTFNPGVVEQEVGVVILDDRIVEEDEEFLVVLSVPEGEEGVGVREGGGEIEDRMEGEREGSIVTIVT